MFAGFVLLAAPSLGVLSLTGAPTVDLLAAAAASGRPAECRLRSAQARSGSPRRSIWRAAKKPALRRYCLLLARSHTRLNFDRGSALADAKAAHKLLPKLAAPRVVLGRIAAKARNWPHALEHFEAALKRNPNSIQQALAMRDYASALRHAGKLKRALEQYRVLVPRATLLPSRQTRGEVLLEAAHVAAAAASSKKRGSAEALAYLREAARDPHQPLRRDVAMSLVLLLSRAGHTAQADALLAEQHFAQRWQSDASMTYLVNDADQHILRGLALHLKAPKKALVHYEKYLAVAPNGQFAAVANTRRQQLRP